MTEAKERNPLTDLSEALADIVRTIGESIVRVEARRRGNSSGVAWSEDGLVVTADHTVRRDEDVRVGLPGGAVVPATFVGRDPTTDLAVLRASETELRPPEWAEADNLKVGHLALSVGRHDERAQASLGVVHKTGGAWRTRASGAVEAYLQTDIAVYPGFSGSALADAAGRVWGMNTSWFGRRSSLALPLQTLRRVIDTLVEHGHVRRGFLGIGAHPAKLPAPAREALGQEAGLLVISIEPGSPADDAGLLVGDLIAALDGEPTPHLDDLMALLTEARIGQAVPLRVVRGGTLKELSVILTERS